MDSMSLPPSPSSTPLPPVSRDDTGSVVLSPGLPPVFLHGSGLGGGDGAGVVGIPLAPCVGV